MTIEYRTKSTGGPRPVLTACPFCGEPFEAQARKHLHFANDCPALDS